MCGQYLVCTDLAMAAMEAAMSLDTGGAASLGGEGELTTSASHGHLRSTGVVSLWEGRPVQGIPTGREAATWASRRGRRGE